MGNKIGKENDQKPILDRKISSRKFQRNLEDVSNLLQPFNPKMKRLRELDLFVLDNSIRETTVGQIRGHTLENKWAIYNEVKKAGFQYCIVESFNHMTRLGDVFLQKLKEAGEDMSYMFAFTELIGVIDENKIPQNDIPIGLIKSKNLGIKNVIMEVDLQYHGIDYTVFNARKICNLLLDRLRWIKQNLGPNSLTFINFRDFSDCMKMYPMRVFKLVNFISSLSPEERPFGILYEELGKYFPEEVGAWTRAVRNEMDNCGWVNGHLLVHVHQQWGLCDATQIECLANGANGIWAGICEEGAAMGHASSCVSIMNLIRMGNKKVTEKFNCKYLRTAAKRVTDITTGMKPHPKQPVYGARSLDIIFGLDPGKSKTEFDYAEFLGIKPPMRITTLASPEMFVIKLEEVFGKNDQFTLEIGTKMKEKLLANLHDERKEEANSKVGLAMLFDQSGGTLTDAMSMVIEKDKSHCENIEKLINEIRGRWDVWDARDGIKDDQVTFDAFYDGFMAPYFGCYRCEDTRRGLKAIDMDCDGMVDWREFALYLKWAGRQYPETKTSEQLLDIAFRKGVIPAMQDVLLENDADTDGLADDKGQNITGDDKKLENSEKEFFDICYDTPIDTFLDENEEDDYDDIYKDEDNEHDDDDGDHVIL